MTETGAATNLIEINKEANAGASRAGADVINTVAGNVINHASGKEGANAAQPETDSIKR